MPKYTTVSIPIELADKLRKRISGTGFHSLSEYTTYILRTIEASAELRSGKVGAFTKEDEKEVKQRLEALGYI